MVILCFRFNRLPPRGQEARSGFFAGTRTWWAEKERRWSIYEADRDGKGQVAASWLLTQKEKGEQSGADPEGEGQCGEEVEELVC